MGWGYRVACVLALAMLAVTWYASVRGWGLRSDTDAYAKRGRDVRAGSLHTRHYYGGGPRFGK